MHSNYVTAAGRSIIAHPVALIAAGVEAADSAEDTRLRIEGHAPMWETLAVVESSLDDVLAELASVPGAPALQAVGEHHFACDGAWWYRGVTLVEAHPRGTLIAHRVYNTAGHAPWLVSLFVWRHRRAGTLEALRTGGVEALAACVAERLGCASYRVSRPRRAA